MGLAYAASIAAQAVVSAALYAGTIAGWPLIQVLLLLAYGVRLGSYLMIRDRNLGYQRREIIPGTTRVPAGTLAKTGIWIGVAVLYVLMALPIFVTLAAQAAGMAIGTLPAGILVMTAGLGLEAVADWQKFRFKTTHPGRFCNTGLYRVVRCPNYLGEMLFWIGLWFSATAAYQGWLQWSLCSAGLACILGIMIGATRRQEADQADRYAADGAFAAYRSTVPVLLPFLPLYSLRSMGADLK